MMTYSAERRPCMVKRDSANGTVVWEKHIFHGWVDAEKPIYEDGRVAGFYRNSAAVVEGADGQVRFVKPTLIRFLDSGQAFKEFEWEDEHEEYDVPRQAE